MLYVDTSQQTSSDSLGNTTDAHIAVLTILQNFCVSSNNIPADSFKYYN